MKLLVTGGAGYIGSHTVYQLCAAGYEVVVLDNLYSGFEWAVPKCAKLIRGDVSDRDLLERIFKSEQFDSVLHFAAHTQVEESVKDPSKYYRNNTMSSLMLFEAAIKNRVSHLIFSSTAAVYGEVGSELVSESHALAPVNPYGASKLMSERILSDLSIAPTSTTRFVVLRYFNVAGAKLDCKHGQATPNATHLVKVAAETAIGIRASMSIFGTDYPTPDGTALRDYIHVEDIARAHLDALAYLRAGGASDVFNVGYGKPYSVRQVIDTMKKVSGVDFKVMEKSRRLGDPTTVAADNSKIVRCLGWTPRFNDLDLICRTAWEWEKTLRSR